MLTLFLAVYLAALQGAINPDPETGRLVDPVVCRENPEQSYALYLPSNYRREKRWPVILALDPGARGRFPVEAYREAAEELGYILIGSNNSKNGPMAAAGTALHAMWQDAFERYSLDTERIYLAGFSGGARMAGRFALLSKRVRAVIACGAGFELPRKGEPIPFSVILTSGSRDSNYLEIKTLNADLLERKVSVRLISFEGGHVWPPPPVCREAVQWLELRAQREGSRTANTELIDALYQQELERGRALESSHRFFDAYLCYLDLKTDLEGLRDLSEAEARIAGLEGSSRLRRSLEEVRRLEKTERRYIKDFLKEFFREKPRKMDWWRDKLNSMEKLEKNKAEDEQYQLLVRRLREFVWRNGWERSWMAGEAGDFERAARLAEIAVLVRSDTSRLFYHLSRMYALSGHPEEALSNLEKAIERGFSDVGSLKTDSAFSALHEDLRFQELIGEQP